MKDKYIIQKRIEDDLFLTVEVCDTFEEAITHLKTTNFATRHILKKVSTEVLFDSSKYYQPKELKEALNELGEKNKE